MTRHALIGTALLAPLLMLAGQAGYAGERFGRPPISSSAPRAPLTEKEAGDAIMVNLKKQFDAAANPSTRLLTKDDAVKSGWGWAADHFSEMDTQHKGAIRFEDIARYVRHRAAIRLPGA
ncbi:hypothetical protein WJ63_09190 [Burkholderia pyrrocinia]|uniref:hypothetical protein n=1 Tax=Burkholderia stagnalis TaxID=1503054 RepID=UPI00075DA00B|nr:hypothetical protein [Burkholderia stagnalis]KVN29493.1 hypothetical protein WJ63_09190 [Burkholderia pyrrocinia]